jgi:hypothetical protein
MAQTNLLINSTLLNLQWQQLKRQLVITFHNIESTLSNPIILSNGTKRWLKNGYLHRTDGPAVEWPNGTKFWFQNGQLHRTDGPAMEYHNGTTEYWINDQRLTEQEWQLYHFAVNKKRL